MAKPRNRARKARRRRLSKRKQHTFPTAAATAPGAPSTTLLTLPTELRQPILQLSLPPSQLATMYKQDLNAHAAALGATHPVIRADMQFVARQWEKKRVMPRNYVCSYCGQKQCFLNINIEYQT